MTPGGHRAARAAAGDSRAILVTGGAQGLGATMVRLFTAAGHRVAVADTDRPAGRHLAAATGCLFVPGHVAAAAVAVLDSPATGQAWEVQAGPATPVRFPGIMLHRTVERTNRAPAIDELRVPERRTR